MNLPSEVNVISFTITHQNNVLFSSNLNNINEELKIPIADAQSLGQIEVKLITESTEIDLTDFNQFDFETESDKLNVFPATFTMAELMPDITFATLLNKLRKWLNVKTVITGNVARLDYVDKQLQETHFADKSGFEIEEPLKETNPIKLYKLQYNKNNFIYIDQNGQAYNPEDYTSQEIETISFDIKLMPIKSFSSSVFTAKRFDSDPNFRVLLYDGLQNNLPVAVESVYGRSLKLREIYETRYKKWIDFLLKAITYTDEFEADTTESFVINEGQYKYNQKHLFEKITKKRISENVWKYTVRSKTIV